MTAAPRLHARRQAPLSNSGGQRGSLPQTRRGLTLLSNSAGTLRSESETERKPEVPVVLVPGAALSNKVKAHKALPQALLSEETK